MRLTVLLVSAAIACAGCAGVPPGEGEIVCAMETPTGSHLPKRVCRHQSTIENDRRTVDMLDERLNRNAPTRTTRPGGNP